jgi:hypothetical protein
VSFAADSRPTLTPAQAKELALWRRLVMGCLWAAAAVLVVEGVLLLWPGVGRTAKLVGIAVFIELAVATVVLGALGRCPACNSSFEAPPGELVPESCRQCGVVLQTRRKR